MLHIRTFSSLLKFSIPVPRTKSDPDATGILRSSRLRRRSRQRTALRRTRRLGRCSTLGIVDAADLRGARKWRRAAELTTADRAGNELIHLQAVDAPVGIRERARVLCDVVHTTLVSSRAGGHGTAGRAVRVAAVVAAEGVVEDDIMSGEVAVDVAASLEVGRWRAELARIGVCLCDGRGRLAGLEEPDPDCRGRPLHGEGAAAGCVEGGAVGLRELGLNAAACATGARTRGAVVGHECADFAGSGDRAAGSCVERHEVIGVDVDALDDVDLAVVGPVGAVAPE